MIKSQIIDPYNKLGAKVCDCDGEEDPSVVVATRPLKVFENSVKFFTNPDHGVDMNVDASFGGTPDQVHDGIDTVLWTGSQPVGGSDVVFNSTDRFYEGAASIYVNRADLGDTWQFAKGSDIDLTGYKAVTMYINVNNNWAAGDNHVFYGWDTALGAMVGNIVNLEDYFNYAEQDVWHKLTIPLADLGLTTATTVDTFRMRCDAVSGTKTRYYIDQIQVEQTTAAAAYTITPDTGTWLYVNQFAISVVDAHAGTLLNGTLPNIPYTGLLSETLTSGITYSRTHEGEQAFALTITDLIGLLELPGVEIAAQGSDGTNTWLTIAVTHQEPLILKPENGDSLEWTISEDLTGLLRLRITAGCSVETRG